MSPFYDSRILPVLFPFEILQTSQLGTSTRFVYLSVINNCLNLKEMFFHLIEFVERQKRNVLLQVYFLC